MGAPGASRATCERGTEALLAVGAARAWRVLLAVRWLLSILLLSLGVGWCAAVLGWVWRVAACAVVVVRLAVLLLWWRLVVLRLGRMAAVVLARIGLLRVGRLLEMVLRGRGWRVALLLRIRRVALLLLVVLLLMLRGIVLTIFLRDRLGTVGIGWLAVGWLLGIALLLLLAVAASATVVIRVGHCRYRM